MRRLACLKVLAASLNDSDIVVTNVGPTRGEWESVRPSDANIYQAGMGNVIPISLGLALALPRRRVVALEGDGSYLMNPGSLATVANERPPNLLVIVFDNECYEATGGQPTATSTFTDIEAVARGFGIRNPKTVAGLPDYRREVSKAFRERSTKVMVAKVERGSSFHHPIPQMDGRENRYRFVRYISRAGSSGPSSSRRSSRRRKRSQPE